MTLLYLTADKVGDWTGGGSVTDNEFLTLCEFGEHDLNPDEQTFCVSRQQMEESARNNPPDVGKNMEPWVWDHVAYHMFGSGVRLAHLYAGTFSHCVGKLKKNGAKVAYTAAAHDVAESRKAHEELGVIFGYPHLTDPHLWKRYVDGYRQADIVVCPSRHSAECMRSYGCERVFVIPHGTTIPEPSTIRQCPKTFRVGYMGNCAAPDKGLAYLLKAWKRLDYKDASLVLAGHDSDSEYVLGLCEAVGVRNVVMLGWVKYKAAFFNNISLYVQPSVTEGFGLEVLEAMAHGRAAVCTTGCGAADVLPIPEFALPARDDAAMADLIDKARTHWDFDEVGRDCREHAKKYSWDVVRGYYRDVWGDLLK